MSASIDAVRKSNRSVSNRIQSILEDADFVRCAADTYAKPVVANKRCGSWYVPPSRCAAEASFKSTDGHTGQWGFSLKRLNLHLLPLINSAGGCLLVDSTRRGKRMPDAFAKTVPIWCAVLNCALLGMDFDAACRFPHDAVSASEIDQIRARLPQWVELFRRNTPPELYEPLARPLRPIWVTPDAPLPERFAADAEIVPGCSAVILCTASRQAQDGELYMGFPYVQGAADDHELWAPRALTPHLLYAHTQLQDRGLSDAELTRRIQAAAQAQAQAQSQAQSQQLPPPRVARVTPMLGVAHADAAARVDGVLIDLRAAEGNAWGVPAGKRGARALATRLPLIAAHFAANPGPYTIVSAPDTDFAEAVALMLDCRFFDAAGALLPAPSHHVPKDEVTRRNMRIIASAGNAPSRTTQNVVGSFLRGS